LGKEAASYRKERAELLKKGQRGGKSMQGKNLGHLGSAKSRAGESGEKEKVPLRPKECANYRREKR
jgi:hypothetical protein